MSNRFFLTVSLPRYVGDGTDLEVVMVPLEVEVCHDGDSLEVLGARVTDFVRLDNSFLLYRAGERHAVSGPDDMERLEAAYRERCDEQFEYRAEDDPNLIEFAQAEAPEDFDQRRAA